MGAKRLGRATIAALVLFVGGMITAPAEFAFPVLGGRGATPAPSTSSAANGPVTPDCLIAVEAVVVAILAAVCILVFLLRLRSDPSSDRGV